MTSRSGDPSPTQLARANRMRLAVEEGARAMEDATKSAIAIRKNMARLKELRLAREEAAMREQPAAGIDPKAKVKKRKR
jgi:hypothetical protein